MKQLYVVSFIISDVLFFYYILFYFLHGTYIAAFHILEKSSLKGIILGVKMFENPRVRQYFKKLAAKQEWRSVESGVGEELYLAKL